MVDQDENESGNPGHGKKRGRPSEQSFRDLVSEPSFFPKPPEFDRSEQEIKESSLINFEGTLISRERIRLHRRGKALLLSKIKSEARFGTLLREGRLPSRAFRDEAFWRIQVNFGPPNPTTDEKALWYGVKGSVYVVTLPAFQRFLEDGPDVAER
ncbi:unnamed protein product [Lactuca virosa]|uniref:Uncharacterized protein n=1 Tax=Lactuca virosa TaxID=75947 RepID=A0AAU9MRI2_9ASTR|nr:unnamed protein product [Lactuca virosa]